MAAPHKTGRKRTPKEQRELIAEIRKRIGNNFTDEEILEQLELTPNLLLEYKSKIIDADRVAFESQDSASAYSDYILKIRQVVRELDQAADLCREKGQGQALVSAIWRKKEAFDSVLKTGQDLGFIEKKPKKYTYCDDFSFTTISDSDVEKEIDKEMKKIRKIAGSAVPIRPEIFEMIPEEARGVVPLAVEENCEPTKRSAPKVRGKSSNLVQRKKVSSE